MSSEQNTPEAPETGLEDAADERTDPPEGDRMDPAPGETPEAEPEVFDRAYVSKLRGEAAKYRQRAQKGDEYGKRLFVELVRATGKLADPSDLPFDADLLDDPAALQAAIADLVTRKPHMASRRPSGDVGQGATPSKAGVDLAAILRQRAG